MKKMQKTHKALISVLRIKLYTNINNISKDVKLGRCGLVSRETIK